MSGSEKIGASVVGKKITSVDINRSHTTIIFNFEDGSHAALVTEGDCCSSSWIEHCSNANELVGATIEGSTDIDVDGLSEAEDKEAESHGEYIQCYGFKVLLQGRPSFEIEFRNSSNGYYGGWIQWSNAGGATRDHIPLNSDF